MSVRIAGRPAGGRALIAAVCLLAAVNVAARVGPRHTTLVLGPAAAAGLILLAQRAGLSYEELVLFGLWHVLPSLRLNRVNPAAAAVVGNGPAGVIVAVAGAAVFTALAGVVLCELRRRSGSLLAPIGLHWAVNGLGVLAAALLSGGR